MRPRTGCLPTVTGARLYAGGDFTHGTLLFTSRANQQRDDLDPYGSTHDGFDHNEPIGPRSSVAEEVDPFRLAMLRAVRSDQWMPFAASDAILPPSAGDGQHHGVNRNSARSSCKHTKR